MLRRSRPSSSCAFALCLGVLLIVTTSLYLKSKNHENVISYSTTNSYYTLPNIDNVLEQTRFTIRTELNNYNWSVSGVEKLEDLVMEKGGQPIRNIVITSWRSGSSFLGDIINSVSGSFYNYEPLLNFDVIRIRGGSLAQKADKLLDKILRCDFDDMTEYFAYAERNHFQFSPNTRLWELCPYDKNLCFDAKFHSKFCKLFPFQLTKLVRVRLSLVKKLLDNKLFDIRVVYLIRDPRGVLQSRSHANFCKRSPDCIKPELVCGDLVSDYFAARQLLKDYPERVIIVRYEELAQDPWQTAYRLFKFLRINPTTSVDKFLETHTNYRVPDPYSTYRVSSEVPFKWKYMLDYDVVDKIQGACRQALSLWGYNLARNMTHLRSKHFNPLGNYTL